MSGCCRLVHSQSTSPINNTLLTTSFPCMFPMYFTSGMPDVVVVVLMVIIVMVVAVVIVVVEIEKN